MTYNYIEIARNKLGFQIGVPEVSMVLQSFEAPINMLIFGCGYDSVFWRNANVGGLTIFLEDDIRWINNISRSDETLDIRRVEYNTKVGLCKSVLTDTNHSYLMLQLDNEVLTTSWDLILVDGPAAVIMCTSRVEW